MREQKHRVIWFPPCRIGTAICRADHEIKCAQIAALFAQVDWDDVRDDGPEAGRSVRYALLVIEPEVSKISSPSGSRTVARVTGPRGVD